MERLVAAGLLIVLVGVLVMVAGIIMSTGGKNVRGGGVVFLGPIPLVFGSDRDTTVTAGVLGLVAMIAYYLIFMRK